MTSNFLQKNEKELETIIHTVRIHSQDIGMESWRLTPSDKSKWKTKFKENISGELENHSRQSSPADTFLTTNKQQLTWQNQDMAKKRKF